jgi:DNA-binding CsgD family transcriptional regulator
MLRNKIRDLAAPQEEGQTALAVQEPPELSERDAAVITLKRQGATGKQISKALNIHHSTVFSILRRHNEISSNTLADRELWDLTYRNYKKFLQGKPIAKGLKPPDNSVILKAMEAVADRKEPKQTKVQVQKEVHTFVHLESAPESVDNSTKSICVQPQSVPTPVNKPLLEDNHEE